LGGYGFVFVGGAMLIDADCHAGAGDNVTMAFPTRPFDRALNLCLLASGLQAKLDGRTLMVGIGLGQNLWPTDVEGVSPESGECIDLLLIIWPVLGLKLTR
jgi:hypothetical protein